MKKKALTVILPLCVAMTMTACGGNAGKTEVEETTVAEESTEADTQAEAEAETPTVVEEAEVVEAEVTVGEEPEEVVEEYDPADQYEGKPYTVSEHVLEMDKSAEYGIFSKSCFDLDQYLFEDGHIIDYSSDEAFNDPAPTQYTGRWAYPEITQTDFMNDLCLSYKADTGESFTFTDAKGNSDVLDINSGPGSYDSMKDYSDSSAAYSDIVPQPMFTANTMDGTVDVLKQIYPNPFDTSKIRKDYIFKVGNFSIVLACNPPADGDVPADLTEEDIQEVIDNIRLTNGLER